MVIHRGFKAIFGMRFLSLVAIELFWVTPKWHLEFIFRASKMQRACT